MNGGSRVAFVLLAVACTRAGSARSDGVDRVDRVDGGDDAVAVASAIDSGVVRDASSPVTATPIDASAPSRPVVFHAFRISPRSGKVDRVGPRSPTPDGETDLVFEVVLEGDVDALGLYSGESSTAAWARRPPPPPAPTPSGPLLPPKAHERSRYPITKHAPDLFAFGTAAGADGGADVIPMPDGGGRRTLVLHTWAPPGIADWRLLAILPDGSMKDGPLLRAGR
jgi:hypothetical protein